MSDGGGAYADILRNLECARPACICHKTTMRGHGATHCPAHDDEHPSLSVSVRDGRLLWDCKAGCDRRVVTEAMRQFLPKPEPPKVVRETTYDYGSAQHRRLDYSDGTKRMWWTPSGVRMSDLPLWNGDLLRESRFDTEPVLLVEGEKDANRGVAFGFCCVSLPGGASQRDFGEALKPLAAREVVLIPDGDKQGWALMSAVADALVKVGVWRIKWMPVYDYDGPPLEGDPPSDHDLSDLLDESADADPRGARALLLDMIEAADVRFER